MKKNDKSKTFFSCYLFVRLDPDEALPGVRWTPGLKRIVSFGEQPAVVRDDVIDTIRHHLKQMRGRLESS